MKSFHKFDDFIGKEPIHNNSVESLEKIFELMGKDYNDFISMSNEERDELVRDLKIKDVLNGE